MNRMSLLLILTFCLTPLLHAQDVFPEAPPATASSTQGDPHSKMMADMHAPMMAMHQREVETMKADIARMRLSLGTIKANVPQITDPTEKVRWQSNVDLWEVILFHMENMLQHMDSMGPSMPDHGLHHDQGGTPPAPSDKKPE